MLTLDLLEAADFLQCERTHALALAGSGQLPGAKIGRRWVFIEEDLAEYLRAEVRQQQRARQEEALAKEELETAVRRNPSMVIYPRATPKKGPKRFDLSGYNQDGTPKLLKDL